MSNNISLHIAKNRKKDCFFTCYEDIEKELNFYPKEQFKDKIVYCNCDTTDSNFYKFFVDNFEKLGLKKIIISCIEYDWNLLTNETSGAYKLEYFGKDKPPNKTLLNGDEKYPPGDFRSSECISLLKEADLVVTNPPFSLLREFIAQLIKYNKKFLIIGNKNAIGCKEIFPLFKENKIQLGVSIHSGSVEFRIPSNQKPYSLNNYRLDEDGNIYVKNSSVRWFTNLNTSKRNKPLQLSGIYYTKESYPKYDNYDAINVDKVAEIPCDYPGVMGVPLTFMDKYCPEQFEILGLDRYTVPKNDLVGGRLTILGKIKYARILTINKHPQESEYRENNIKEHVLKKVFDIGIALNMCKKAA